MVPAQLAGGSRIGRLLTERARLGDAPLLSDRTGRVVTFAAVERARKRLASACAETGVGPGSGVLLRPRDLLEYATGFFALLGAGMVVVPVDPAAPAEELGRIAGIAGPAALLGDGLELSPREGPPRPPEGSAGVFLCTSGTTGTPKGVYLDEDRLLHVAGQVCSHHGITAGEKGLCLLPLYHVNAEVVGLLSSLLGGAELVVEERFHRTGFWELVEREEITWINAAPAIIAVLASTAGPQAPPARVRFARSASAPLAAGTMRQFEEKTGIPVLESYGMTEAASMITANPLGAGRPGSVGLAVGAEVRVVEGPRRVASGEVGRVQVRGPGVIAGYAVGGGADAIDADGWLETNDLGYLDQEGFLYLVGRSDDVINRGGEKVYPREVEEVLMASRELAAAVVVGEPHPILGGVPVAYVVPVRLDGSLEGLVTRLERRCRSELSSYKRPSEIHVVEALPVGPTGKVRRREVTPSLLRAAR